MLEESRHSVTALHFFNEKVVGDGLFPFTRNFLFVKNSEKIVKFLLYLQCLFYRV